jgi:hypothetical protein
MPDRVEREIEEILSKLEDKDPRPSASKSGPPREPIPLRPRRKPSLSTRIVGALPTFPNLTPATLLFTGAGVMIAGLILSAFADGLIWVSFAGVVVFLGAFLWAFLRRTTPGQATSRHSGSGGSPKGVYWRDRYIDYEPGSTNGGSVERFKRIFRRR